MRIIYQGRGPREDRGWVEPPQGTDAGQDPLPEWRVWQLGLSIQALPCHSTYVKPHGENKRAGQQDGADSRTALSSELLRLSADLPSGMEQSQKAPPLPTAGSPSSFTFLSVLSRERSRWNGLQTSLMTHLFSKTILSMPPRTGIFITTYMQTSYYVHYGI